MDFETTDAPYHASATVGAATGSVMYLDGDFDELLKRAEDSPSEPQTELETLVDVKNGGELSISELQDYIAGWRPEVQLEINRSHRNLYQLNRKPFEFACLIVRQSDAVIADAMRLALQNEMVRAGIVKKTAKTMSAKAVFSATVKLSFGVERRLVHVYTKVNWAAFQLGIKPADLPSWIEAQGGVEKIRRSEVVNGVLVSEEEKLAELRKKALDEKAEARQKEDDLLAANVIASFPSDGLQSQLHGMENHQFALLVTLTADKQLAIHGVVKPDAESVLQQVRHAAYAGNKSWLEREPMPSHCEPPTGQAESN